jgi:type VI secretion system protein VasG
MLRGLVATLEKHHQLRILDEAVTATVRLSHRYIAGRQLPDKAVSVLDTACARLSLGQNSTPSKLEDILRQIDSLEVQKRVLERETKIGADHAERLEQIKAAMAAAKQDEVLLREQWEKEKGLIERIRKLQEGLVSPDEAAALGKDSGARAELGRLEAELEALQGERGMMRVSVDAQIVGEVISAWTGIPLGKMVRNEIETVLTLDEHLKKRVIGQDHALATIAQRILTSRANLDDPVKPVGVFLLVGPSGVGKTETAIALAEVLYGGERNMITINMSEFQEAHTVSTLKGSPPGYVGYGEGGVLTEAVRRRPYSVVLLDEVEKAHPDVLELFFQVFDKGRMEDAEGREIDFRNTIILLTSNAATDTFMKLCADPETMPDSQGMLQALKPELNKIFKPAFLGRLLIVPYFPVRDEALKQIIRLKLGKIQRRLMESHKIALDYDDALLNEVAARCTEVESGARNVDNILSNTMLPDLSRQILSRIAEGVASDKVSVTVRDGALTYAWDSTPSSRPGEDASRSPGPEAGAASKARRPRSKPARI